MSQHVSQFASGAAQAAGQDFAHKLCQTPQGQQALQATANGVAQGGAAVVGAGVAVYAAGAAAAAAAAPIVVASAVLAATGYVTVKLLEWWDSL